MRERTERVNGPYRHGSKFRVVITRPDGTQHAESFETEKEALGVVESARKQIEGRTVTQAIEAYEASMTLNNLRHSSILRARAHLDTMFKDVAGRKLTWVTPTQARRLYDRVQVGRAVDTHRGTLKVTQRFGRWCVKQGWLASDPFANVEGVGQRSYGKPQLRVDEARKLLAVCLSENSRESLAVAVALLLGMRASEIAHRTVRDLDDGGRVLVIEHGKTAAATRSHEVPESIRPQLLALAGNRPASAWLFAPPDDISRPSRYWVHYHCVRLCKLAKVPAVPPHGLRGTQATIATQAHTVGHAVSAALGHSSTAITEQAYLARGTKSRAATKRAVDRLIGGNSEASSRYQGAQRPS